MTCGRTSVWCEESIPCCCQPQLRNVDRQNTPSHDYNETSHHNVLPDGEQRLGGEQVLRTGLNVSLGHLDLSDHELNLLLADPAQVPVGGREEPSGESVMTF